MIPHASSFTKKWERKKRDRKTERDRVRDGGRVAERHDINRNKEHVL